MAKSWKKLEKVVKNWEKWEGGKKWQKVGKSREKWPKVVTTGFPAGEPTDDSTNGQGVSGIARRGKSTVSPNSKSPSPERYWSIVAGLGGGLQSASSHKDRVIGEVTGS